MIPILDKISDVIDGTIVFENDIFYVLKKDGRKTEFSLEAEGLRKLGLLWKLVRNGLLEKDSILLWDEPEANLNPELYPLIAEILLELQKNGVQIFLATHSYNFAKYLEMRREKEEQKEEGRRACQGKSEPSDYRQGRCRGAGIQPRHRGQGIYRSRRPVRLRQIDDAAHDRRSRGDH